MVVKQAINAWRKYDIPDVTKVTETAQLRGSRLDLLPLTEKWPIMSDLIHFIDENGPDETAMRLLILGFHRPLKPAELGWLPKLVCKPEEIKTLDESYNNENIPYITSWLQAHSGGFLRAEKAESSRYRMGGDTIYLNFKDPCGATVVLHELRHYQQWNFWENLSQTDPRNAVFEDCARLSRFIDKHANNPSPTLAKLYEANFLEREARTFAHVHTKFLSPAHSTAVPDLF